MILGHALGDALGAPQDFPPFDEYIGELIPIRSQSRWQGIRVSALGQVTDDTEMAMCIFYALQDGVYSRKQAILEYMQWANGKIPFLGKNTRNLFKGVKTISGYESRRKKFITDVPRNKWSQSNGCLMRAYPLALLHANAAEEDCKITNPAEICVEAVCIYTEALKYVLLGASKDDVFAMVNTAITQPELRKAFDDAIEDRPRNIAESRGWVAHAFYAAFWCLRNFDNYHEAMRGIILHSTQGRLRGDTDTNAAIAGALLGAYYGIDHLCANRQTCENLRVLIRADTTTGDIPRPEKYHMNLHNFILLGRIAMQTELWKRASHY